MIRPSFAGGVYICGPEVIHGITTEFWDGFVVLGMLLIDFATLEVS